MNYIHVDLILNDQNDEFRVINVEKNDTNDDQKTNAKLFLINIISYLMKTFVYNWNINVQNNAINTYYFASIFVQNCKFNIKIFVIKNLKMIIMIVNKKKIVTKFDISFFKKTLMKNQHKISNFCYLIVEMKVLNVFSKKNLIFDQNLSISCFQFFKIMIVWIFIQNTCIKKSTKIIISQSILCLKYWN